MKRILIPTDFSENAGDALDYALHLLKGQATEVHITHAVAPVVVPMDAAGSTVTINNVELEKATQAMQALEEFSRLFFEQSGQTKMSLSTSVEVGEVAVCVKNKAEELQIDLIIMGTQGSNHSSLEKMIGTISTDVISDAPCPVILVPKAYQFEPIDNVVFSTNLNHAHPYELWKATELLSPNVAQVQCLYVTPDKTKEDENELAKFAAYLTEHSPSVQASFEMEESKDTTAMIAEYAEYFDAEMIIMHHSKKTLWERVFSPRQTKKMAFWAKVPLMVING